MAGRGCAEQKSTVYLTYKRFPEHDKYNYKIEISKPSFSKNFSSKKMPEKDELRFTSDDIPYILKNMTQTPDETNAVPGTEVTQQPGLIPEAPNAIPGFPPGFDPASLPTDNIAPDPAQEVELTGNAGGYNPTEVPYHQDNFVEGTSLSTAPPAEYVPPYDTHDPYMNTGTVDAAYAAAYPANPGYDPTNDQPPTHPNSDDIHNELMEDPKYAVHVHEAQLNRIIQCLEELVNRVNDVDNKVMHLEEAVRFDQEHHHHDHTHDGPPESPTGTDYGQAIN